MSKATTVYGRAQEMWRAEEQEARRHRGGAQLQRRAAGGAKCGAKKRGGGTCLMAAGFGTTHPGLGRCKYHGGNLPTHKKNAIKREAQLLGAPMEINPLDAIIWCIKMTAGEIEFYTEQMTELNRLEWLEETIMGKQMHVFARERALAQDRLVRYSKDAVTLGLAERAVKLAEQYGNTIARLIKGLIDDLTPYLSDEGIKLIPTLVRKHLVLAEQGREGAMALSSNGLKAIEAAQ